MRKKEEQKNRHAIDTKLYKISAQLAKARNNMDAPFRGINMIFAGDFAQLMPVQEQPFIMEM